VPQAVKKRTAVSALHTAHPDGSFRFMKGSVPKVLEQNSCLKTLGEALQEPI
jgi:hypothetical protein